MPKAPAEFLGECEQPYTALQKKLWKVSEKLFRLALKVERIQSQDDGKSVQHDHRKKVSVATIKTMDERGENTDYDDWEPTNDGGSWRRREYETKLESKQKNVTLLITFLSEQMQKNAKGLFTIKAQLDEPNGKSVRNFVFTPDSRFRKSIRHPGAANLLLTKMTDEILPALEKILSKDK